ncbi:MAG: Ig-like domain-containing protein [Nostocaceae cyanobacterium]|nr:Ig-like domain-containing protein [Nostocaceae cyanobacterium]
MTTRKAFFQPLDRVAIIVIVILSLLTVILISQGNAVKASVRNFSWEDKQINANEIAFSLTFSRPMDTETVEENLKIEPPLAGKFSWAGRRMVYTLLTPAPYGTKYTVELEGAKEQFAAKTGQNRSNEPFSSTFRTRDRVILYIGVEQGEQGRLILYNLTQQDKKKLTPGDIIVTDFKPYPNGEKILFSARPSGSDDLLAGKLYSTTTGINAKFAKEAEPPGKVDLILDNKDYQILKFDLSANGETIVVQRGNKANPGDFGLWFMPANGDKKSKPQRLQSEPGGDFIITPDSQAVAVAQGQGAAILPLQTDASKPLDFLPQFGLVQAFSKDGTKAAMVKFNTDYTRDLFLVTNQGSQKQLLKTTGSIINCQFDPASPTLYCLLTQLIPGGVYQEQAYLVAIDLKTTQQKPLLVLPPEQRNVKMSLSPDGLGLLFDQIIPQNPNSKPSSAKQLTSDDGQPIATSKLWLMPLMPISDAAGSKEIKPEQLPLAGFNPSWLP